MENDDLSSVVSSIIRGVREDGDGAIRRFSKEFDHVSVEALRVPDDVVENAYKRVGREMRGSLAIAAEQISNFHRSQRSFENKFSGRGISITERSIPIRRVGAYVPGGRFVYPSSVLMTCIPARVAGVEQIILCTPPDSQGLVPDVTLAASKIAEIDEVFVVGGAQAIAAMAYGTESIDAVDLIVGPGNRFVNEAKRQVFGDVGIDSLAGPSEVVIMISREESVDQAIAAARAQCEHGPDSRAIVLATNPVIIRRLSAAANNQIVVEQVESDNDGLARINELAPEHVEIYSDDAAELALRVENAGAIFCNTSAVVGDYIAGTNHVLPTNRAARFSNGLRVDTFLRWIPIVSGEPSESLRYAGEVLARAEGLECHADVLSSMKN